MVGRPVKAKKSYALFRCDEGRKGRGFGAVNSHLHFIRNVEPNLYLMDARCVPEICNSSQTHTTVIVILSPLMTQAYFK